MADEAEICAIAVRLAAQAGLARPLELERLPGGRNNRVFRVPLASGDTVVLKSYFSDGRDRLGAEWSFLRYAWARGIRNIPQPLVADRACGCGLYGFVVGRRLVAGEVGDGAVRAAIDFVGRLNAGPRRLAELPIAAEACFTIEQHLATVDHRVAAVAALDPAAPYWREAENFVAERLSPSWLRVRQAVVDGCARLGLPVDRALRPDEICVSPSDFGFHNALVDAAAGLSFLDFEYAGQDDPAKLIADFFCQPDVPVPASYFGGFADAVLAPLGLGSLHRERARLLRDTYRIKWACILLNEFLAAGAARRAFASAESRVARCAERLAKAAAGLDLLEVA
jgi:hypothetical protein